MKFVVYLFAAVSFSSANAGAYEDFFRAVDTDDARTVTGLLGRGFDPNSPSEQGQVGLFLALRAGSGKVVAALLANPATRIDAANEQGETPLMMAALRGELEAVRTLVDRGAQLRRDGWTPLHYAASGPDPKVVALLLERGAPVDALSPNRTTPLMMASRYGPDEAAQRLLERGANARLRNDKGLSAGDFARLGGREALAQKLDGLAR